jgi:hypothetical protein
MPKDITHWIISMKTAEALRGTIMGNAALSNQNALKLGAIFPDILFYLPNDPAISRYRDIANSLHGNNGEDTYELIRQILTVMKESPYRQEFLSFLLGVITHIQTDAVFHPMVYYLTGNYHDAEPSARSRAIEQHRCFECLIDLYFCGGSRHVKGYGIKSILKNLELPLPQLLKLSQQLNRHQINLSDMNVMMMQALRNLQIIQEFYKNRVIAGVFYAIKPFLFGTVKEIAALFYSPQLDRFIPQVSGTLHYKNSITGEIKNASLSGLLEEAVGKSSTLARKIEKTVAADIIESFSERGPSLSYGLIMTNADRPMYFAEKPFI